MALKVIQIIAILQGIFLGFTLFQRREAYKKPIFNLFIGCIVSVILFSVGDDDYNLIMNDSKWFFLFIRYSNTEKNTFSTLNVLFCLPYVIHIVFETLINSSYFENNVLLNTVGELIELSFLVMLLYSIRDIFICRKNKWLLVFIIPFTVVFIIDKYQASFSLY